MPELRCYSPWSSPHGTVPVLAPDTEGLKLAPEWHEPPKITICHTTLGAFVAGSTYGTRTYCTNTRASTNHALKVLDDSIVVLPSMIK